MLDQLHTDIKTTAQTIWAEARGDGIAGMTAVADVIANRVAAAKVYIEEKGENHPLFGDGTFDDCCRRPWQFSCWNRDDPNLPKMINLTISDPIFLQAMQIATQAVSGLLVDGTKASTYYYAKSLKTPPDWAEGLTPCVTIGSQYFFNDVP